VGRSSGLGIYRWGTLLRYKLQSRSLRARRRELGFIYIFDSSTILRSSVFFFYIYFFHLSPEPIVRMAEKTLKILQQEDASRDISSPKSQNGADVFDYCLYN
jgi:hypothetical protein